MSSLMFPYIGRGCSRTVYAINDDMVIKVARYLTNDSGSNIAKWGIDQCKTELDTYLKYGDKMPFCKIYVDMCTDERIVMERVTPLSDLPNEITDFDGVTELVSRLEFGRENEPGYLESLHPAMQRFAEKILKSGLTRQEIRSILTDVEYSNMGIKDGELYILDFGMYG